MKDHQQTIRRIYILKVIVFICLLCDKEHGIKAQGFQAGLPGSLQDIIGCHDSGRGSS